MRNALGILINDIGPVIERRIDLLQATKLLKNTSERRKINELNVQLGKDIGKILEDIKKLSDYSYEFGDSVFGEKSNGEG